MMMTVFVVVGTRPEAIKLLPVWKALRNCGGGMKPMLVITGQHGPEMMEPLISFFKVRPDISLNVKNPSLKVFAANLLLSLDHAFSEHKPDMVVVQGDTTSAMIASMAAFYSRIQIAHVEAGLRTYNRWSPFPEETNRRVISLMADIHFAPTEDNKRNLIDEKVQGEIHVVGNTVIDSLLDASHEIDSHKKKYLLKFDYILKSFGKVVMITAHRRENIGRRFIEIYQAIRQLALEYSDFAFVFVLHTNPDVRKDVLSIRGITNIFLIEPLPYDEMVFLLRESYMIMTDSGGLQEECPSLDKPLIVLRDTTERPEGIEAGCSILGGIHTEDIVAAFTRIVNDEAVYKEMAGAVNPYGDGHSSKRIAACITRFSNRDDKGSNVMNS